MNLRLRALCCRADRPGIDWQVRARVSYPRLRQCGTLDGNEMGIGQPHGNASPQGRETVLNDQSAPCIGHLRLDEPDDPRVEAHEPVRAAVVHKGLPKGRRQPPHIPIDLDLEQERDPSADKLKEVRQCRNAAVRDAQGRDVCNRGAADPVWAAAQAHRIVIMKDDDMSVGGKPKIALDPGTNFERSFERRNAVLGRLESGVQASMGEARRAGVERVSP